MKSTGLRIGGDSPLPRPQHLPALTSGIRTHPFPEFDRLRIEPPRGKQTKFSTRTSVRVKHLHAGKIRLQDSCGGFRELVIEAIIVTLVVK
jgi:hypothetical protein